MHTFCYQTIAHILLPVKHLAHISCYLFFMNERLKQLRIEKGLTQKQVALAVGLTKNAVTNYEAGYREPSIDILKRLCLLFDVSSDYLIGLTDSY